MATVHLIHGLPGSGKTTYARKLVAQHGAVLLNHDERMIALHGANPPEVEFARLAHEISEALWSEATQHLSAGNDVVLDWGFWTRASRDDARFRAQAMGSVSVLHRMLCADATARARAIARSSARTPGALLINAEAWDVFRERFEPIASDEKHLDVEAP